MIALLMADVYIALLAKDLGFTDGVTGVITSIINLGGVFQAVTLFLKKKSPKRFVITLSIINQVLFGLLYVIPLVNENIVISSTVKQVAFVVCILSAYLIYNIAAPRKNSWMMSFVDKSKLGRFRADLEIFSHIIGTAFTFTMGNVMDLFKNRSAELEAVGDLAGASAAMHTSFIICAIIIFVMLVSHTIIFACCNDIEPMDKTQSGTVKRMKELFKDKSVRMLILLFIVYKGIGSISTPFYGTYKMGELGFSMKYASLMTIMYSVIGIFVSRLWGAYADRHTFTELFCVAYPLVVVGYLVCSFCVPSNGRIVYALYFALNAFSVTGTWNAALNLMYKLVDKSKWEDAYALIFVISGLASFFITTVVSPFVTYVQSRGNTFIGMNVYAQQVLSFASFVASLLFYLYMVFIFRKKYVPIEKKVGKGE